MALVIHGVNNIDRFSFSYYSLSTQIIITNIITTFIGLLFLFFFNYSILQNNQNVEKKIKNISNQTENISAYLENHAIIRIPQFNEENCERFINSNNNLDNNFNCGEVQLSDPQLDPSLTQNYLIDKYFNQTNSIKVYDANLLKFADTEDLYLPEAVIEVDLEKNNINQTLFSRYKGKYLQIYNEIQRIIDKNKLQKYKADIYKGDISLVIETIKSQDVVTKLKNIKNNNIFLTKSIPIIKNDNTYGVVLVSGNLIQENTESALISFNLFNLFIIIVFFMFLLSFFFLKSIISPIKKLSNIVNIERNKMNINNLELDYPIRNDEIGSLSKEIKNMSVDLKERINEIENFAADVSHELKNPLASIKSSNEILSNKNITKENKKLLLENIKKDVDRMNVLISDISNYTRIQAEIDVEAFVKINIVKFINEIIQSYLENKKNIKIEFRYEKNSRQVLANKNKLAQVIVNLLDNSLSFGPKNSNILIFQTTNKNNMIIYFIDQGPGIKSSLKNKIFERFYTDRSENDEYHSGLGLSISKRIIESFGGKIELVKSPIKYYKGACFNLEIPLKD